MHRAGFLHICLLTVILLLNALMPSNGGADGIRLFTEFQYNSTDSDTKIKDTGEKISSEFTRFDQRYDLDLSKTLYPFLLFATGAVYEHRDAEAKTEDLDFNTTEKILRPFVELNLNNPIYQAGMSYRKTRIEEEITDLPDSRLDRDQYTAILGMTPSREFPEWNFSFIRTLTWDDPETVDRRLDVYNFETLYSPWRPLLLDYSYIRTENDDRLRNFETTDQTHFGRAEYSQDFFNQRLSFSTRYNIRHNIFEFPSSATVEQPLARSSGLSSLDNTPDDGPALTNNAVLIDGNVTASAGLNIGTSGDQATLVNIGLDFGFPIDVDQIRVWVDRRLTAVVAGSFSWAVYTSPDNLDTSTWTLVATINPADFGAADNRFEIFFPVVNTRYIKVVTSPLALTTPGARDFENIFVTEMEGFVTVSGAEVDNKQTTTDHNYNLNLRGRLTAKTTLGYNLLYSLQQQNFSDDDRTQLTNDVFLNHIFNNVFSFNARGQRSDNSLPEEDTTDYTYGASLKARWLRTLDQSLTYSGRYFDEEEGNAYQNSIFLRSNAILYKGWSAFVDGGYGWERPVGGPQITTNIVKGGTNFVPNSKLNFNLNYSYRRTDQSGLDIGPKTEKIFDIQGFYLPFSNLSFFAKFSRVDRDNGPDDFINFNANWSPFPDGDLQFFFNYTEILRPQSDITERVVGPGLKWTIGRFGFLDLTYSYTQSENDVQKTDSSILDANLRIVY